MTTVADIVDDFLTRLSQHAPELPADVATRIEADIRSQWGGTDRGYIRKLPAAHTPAARMARRTQALAQGLAAGHDLASVFQAAGVPRCTGYRLMRRKA